MDAPKHTLEFKKKAIKLSAKVGRAVAAKELKIAVHTLRNWDSLDRDGKLEDGSKRKSQVKPFNYAKALNEEARLSPYLPIPRDVAKQVKVGDLIKYTQLSVNTCEPSRNRKTAPITGTVTEIHHKFLLLQKKHYRTSIPRFLTALERCEILRRKQINVINII